MDYIDYAGVIGSVASVVGIAAPICVWIKRKSETKDKKENLALSLAQDFANDVEVWFGDRFKKFEQLASNRSLLGDKISKNDADMIINSHGIDGFPGGLYILNEKGIVIYHYTPNHPDMNILGYNASKRPYFIKCDRLKRPIASNCIESADRNELILVVAVPRYDERAQFVGILDGVIDLISEPFSRLALNKAMAFKENQGKNISTMLYLLDENLVVIGSNNKIKSKSIGGDPVIEKLIREYRSPESIVIKFGRVRAAICAVKGTPYVSISCLKF